MVSFIDDHREAYGVEPICRVVPIAPSTYYEEKAREQEPALRPPRYHRDAELREKILEIRGQKHFENYGARKTWKELRRRGTEAARCTVARLMRGLGLRGTIRGRTVKTTVPDLAADRPLDHVERHFHATAPNQLWVADLTYVATWRGFVYVAFVVDVFSRRIVGWRASSSRRTDLALDALDQALYDRASAFSGSLIHHSDRGSQYVSISYTDRLINAGIEPSVGSKGDSYDNALAETIIGLYKAEVIRRLGPWRDLDHVELETLDWVTWFNRDRILDPIGDVPPAEFEMAYYEAQDEATKAVALN